MQTSFLERIGLDMGVHISISSITDLLMSSSASDLTSLCASSNVPSRAEACLLRIVFSCKDLVQVALHCATCAVVVYFAYLARLLMNLAENSRSFILRLVTCWPHDDAQVKAFHLAMVDPVLISLSGCARPGLSH